MTDEARIETMEEGAAPEAATEPTVSDALRLDGEPRSLSRRWVTVKRIGNWIAAGVGGGTAIVGMSVWYVGSGGVFALLALIGAVLATIAFAILGHWYPMAAYRRTQYALNERGIEIRRGVLWRQVVSVPRQRVQHTDVQQGPLMRRYAISKLVIHTAGTQHATVSLEGIEHDVALGARDHLIGREVGRHG